MPNNFIALILVLIPSLAFATPDYRISDNEGHVLNINSDGTLPISTTIETPGTTVTGTSDLRLSDNAGEIMNVNSNGSITLKVGSPN